MKAIPATVCLLLVGCAGIMVTPDQKPPLTTLWDTEIFSNRTEFPSWSPELIPLQSIEFGRRSDGLVVWRTNQLALNEAEAWRLWRAAQDQALRQHDLDRGREWQLRISTNTTPPAPDAP